MTEKPADYLRQAREIEGNADLSRNRIAVLGSFTAEFLRPYLVVESSRAGWLASPWFAPFNIFEQVILDDDSELWRQEPEVVWITLRIEDTDRYLVDELPEIGAQQASERLREIRQRIVHLATEARQRTRAAILVSNLTIPARSLTNIFDANDPDGLSHLVAEENRALARDLMALTDVHVFDYAGTVAEAGADTWCDPKLWYMGRIACGAQQQPILARRLARCIAALLRAPAKCVVVDLDNTLWGGVLGDDGPGGIQIGDDYPGNVFKDIQAALLALRRRGFVLAVASKNDEQPVRDVLESHPDMLLRWDHFACVEANWGPKTDSLRKIAASLNIGVDALVFIDDNPIERAQVRAELPQVNVVELPARPLDYLGAIQAEPALDRPRLLSEDRAKARMYQHEAQRQTLQRSSNSIEEFLSGLEMKAEVGTCDEQSLARVHQLIHKTNQYNLTTRRHAVEDIHQLMESPDAVVAWLRLSDRLGDMGLVCVGILNRAQGDTFAIDTFLMSCRVMGRGVEDAFLAYLADMAQQRGASRLCGLYAATPKNHIVADFYPAHDFQPVSQTVDAALAFERDIVASPLTWPSTITRVNSEESI